MAIVSSILSHRELLWNLAARELKQRYKGSALGFFWSVLNPLFMTLVYLVFLRLLARGVPLQDIVIGVFAWQFHVQCVMGGMGCVIGNGNLVKKVAFPREILPVAQVTANLVSYLLSLLVQFPFLLFLVLRSPTEHFSAAWPLFFVWLAVQTFFELGLAALFGAINVYFRDTEHIVGILLSAWFFMSPVMYNMAFASNVAASFPWVVPLLYLNPAAVILNGYRHALLASAPLNMPPTAWIGLAIVPVVFFVGLAVFHRLQRNFADLL